MDSVIGTYPALVQAIMTCNWEKPIAKELKGRYVNISYPMIDTVIKKSFY